MTTRPFDQDRPPERARNPLRGTPRTDGRPGRRRRRDGDVVVPEAEFASYYGRNIVKPAPWEHEIADYLFLGGLAAGSALIASGASFTNRPHLRRRARISSLVAIGLGGNALIADLGRPERFLNMMRTAKLTSPMSIGSWILTGFSVTTVAATVTANLRAPEPVFVAARQRLHLDGPAGGTALAWADHLASAGSAFFSPPLAAYTAVLFSDTATPLWHESYRELPFIFTASATAAGSGLAMITSPTGETGPVRQLAVLGGTCDLVADHLLERRLGEEGEPLHTGTGGRFHRAAKALTAVGTVAAAVAGRNKALNVAAGACLMAGSACTRYAFYHAGLASASDPVYTVRPQRRRAAEKATQGRGVTQPGGEWPKGPSAS